MDQRLRHIPILRWFHFGDMHLAVARNSAATMHPKPLEIICLHCQQAVEKYLKGYLIAQSGGNPLKTYDLAELCALCQGYEQSFVNLEAACSRLTMYAAQTWYPDGIDLEETDMEYALGAAIKIKFFPFLAELREKLEQEGSHAPNP